MGEDNVLSLGCVPILLILMAGPVAAAEAAVAAAGDATTVLYDAQIFTADYDHPYAEALPTPGSEASRVTERRAGSAWASSALAPVGGRK